MQPGILNFEQVKELWINKFSNWKPNETFNLYIDNPFCVSKCEFCIHFGTKTAIASETYNKYYNEYLPKLIEDYSEILQMRTIDSIYFGGGTPSMMTIPIMENIFSKIPGFVDIKEKSFEAHPAFINKDKIDVLAKNKFSYMSFGIQTFDQKICKGQNRILINPDKIKDYIQYAQEEKGITINCDLLAFIETGSEDDLETLKNDLDILLNYIKPNAVTIYPMYQRFSFDFEEAVASGTKEDIEKSVDKIIALYKFLFKTVRHSNDYHLGQNLQIDRNVALKDMLQDIYILRIPTEEFRDRVKKYSCSSFPFNPNHQNVIGLGGYGSRAPYSYQGRKIYYNIVNDDWEPRYEVKVFPS